MTINLKTLTGTVEIKEFLQPSIGAHIRADVRDEQILAALSPFLKDGCSFVSVETVERTIGESAPAVTLPAASKPKRSNEQIKADREWLIQELTTGPKTVSYLVEVSGRSTRPMTADQIVRDLKDQAGVSFVGRGDARVYNYVEGEVKP